MIRYLITSALPYINGIKHLGNIAGSLLPADVYAKHLRQQGEEVLYICGTDEHGTPAELAAKANNQSVEEYCETMYQTQKSIYEAFAIEFDFFGRSSSKANHVVTQSVFKDLYANGYIQTCEIQQVYSKTDARFLPDRYVEGTCPHCQYEKARGDQCEACGRLLDTTDLLSPRSAISGSTDLEVRQSMHLFLDLAALSDRVSQWVDQHPDWPATTKGIAKKWLQEGLHARCISRDLKWGIKIPKENFDDKVFYVWFDAPNGYISMTQEWAETQGEPDAWQRWWQSNLDEVIYTQFMAKDNVPFHAIFWPAMLMGTGKNWKLVDQLKAFNWLTYEGGKFSTSQQRGVFSDQALKLFPADYWRYFLTAAAPESSDSDFTFAGFANLVNKDLADVLGNFVNRATAIIKKHFDNKIPTYNANNRDVDELKLAVSQLVETIDVEFRACRFRPAMQAMRELWCWSNEYIAREEPWKVVKTDKVRAADILMNCLHLMRISAITAASVIPEAAQKILTGLGEQCAPSDSPFRDCVVFNYFPVGRELVSQGNLFQKIDEEQVAVLTAEYAGQPS